MSKPTIAQTLAQTIYDHVIASSDELGNLVTLLTEELDTAANTRHETQMKEKDAKIADLERHVEFQRENIRHLDEVICRLDKKEGNDV